MAANGAAKDAKKESAPRKSAADNLWGFWESLDLSIRVFILVSITMLGLAVGTAWAAELGRNLGLGLAGLLWAVNVARWISKIKLEMLWGCMYMPVIVTISVIIGMGIVTQMQHTSNVITEWDRIVRITGLPKDTQDPGNPIALHQLIYNNLEDFPKQDGRPGRMECANDIAYHASLAHFDELQLSVDACREAAIHNEEVKAKKILNEAVLIALALVGSGVLIRWWWRRKHPAYA